MTQQFSLRDAVVVTDTGDAALAVHGALRMNAVPLEGFGPQFAEKPVVVLTTTEERGLERVKELIASGVNPNLVRFVAHGDQPIDAVLDPINRDWLRGQFQNPGHHWWNTGRFLISWPNEGDLEAYTLDIEGLDTHARLAPGTIVAVVGGYGSGKSTFAQRIVQSLAHRHGLPGSVCAWEDRRNDFRARTWRYALGPEFLTVADKSAAVLLERKLWWWEPTKIDERTVDQYFEWVERTTKEFGLRVHLLDPWNELDHEYGSGQNETQYTRKVMMHVQRLTRELGIIFIVVCHLPKAGYDDQGRVKPFRVVHAAGSAEFGNKASHGFCVARTTRLYAALDPEAIGDQDEREAALAIVAEHGPPLGREHMVVAVDKVKIEPDLGQRGVFAYWYDRSRNQLVLDNAATAVVRDIWRVF